MFLYKLMCLLCISLVMAYPLVERTLSFVNDHELVERAVAKPAPPAPSKKPPPSPLKKAASRIAKKPAQPTRKLAGTKKALGSTSESKPRTNARAKKPPTPNNSMRKGPTRTTKQTSSRNAQKRKPAARKGIPKPKSPTKKAPSRQAASKKSPVRKSSSHSQTRKNTPAVAKKKSVAKQASKKLPGGREIKNSSGKKPSSAAKKPPSKASRKSSGGKNSSTKKPSPAAKKPASKTSPDIVRYTGGGVEELARKANNAPGRKICKAVSDCSCPSGPGHSTSCINGVCQCDNKVVATVGKEFLQAAKAVGDAPITKGVNQVFKTMADVKQVGGTVVGAAFGPAAGRAFKVASNVIPDVGSSHIDDATRGAMKNIL